MKSTSLKLLVVHRWFLCFNFIKHVRTYLLVVNNISISLLIAHFYKTTRSWCDKIFKGNSIIQTARPHSLTCIKGLQSEGHLAQLKHASLCWAVEASNWHLSGGLWALHMVTEVWVITELKSQSQGYLHRGCLCRQWKLSQLLRKKRSLPKERGCSQRHWGSES